MTLKTATFMLSGLRLCLLAGTPVRCCMLQVLICERNLPHGGKSARIRAKEIFLGYKAPCLAVSVGGNISSLRTIL